MHLRIPVLSFFVSLSLSAAELPKAVHDLLDSSCFDCHDDATQKGDLDLMSLEFDPTDKEAFAKWVLVFDRVRKGEMPPKKKKQPSAVERNGFLAGIGKPLLEADRSRQAQEGRGLLRRLNRTEYEYHHAGSVRAAAFECQGNASGGQSGAWL